MDNNRLQNLGDRWGGIVEEKTDVDLGINFGVAITTLHEAIDETGEEASDNQILEAAGKRLEKSGWTG